MGGGGGVDGLDEGKGGFCLVAMRCDAMRRYPIYALFVLMRLWDLERGGVK